jgi:hypothetical protein
MTDTIPEMSWCNKKNEGGISRARVNSVAWITNHNSHTPVSNRRVYFIQGCLVILSKLYDRPSCLNLIKHDLSFIENIFIDYSSSLFELDIWFLNVRLTLTCICYIKILIQRLQSHLYFLLYSKL